MGFIHKTLSDSLALGLNCYKRDFAQSIMGVLWVLVYHCYSVLSCLYSRAVIQIMNSSYFGANQCSEGHSQSAVKVGFGRGSTWPAPCQTPAFCAEQLQGVTPNFWPGNPTDWFITAPVSIKVFS